MCYVYLLRSQSSPKQVYTGFTEDLRARSGDQQSGKSIPFAMRPLHSALNLMTAMALALSVVGCASTVDAPATRDQMTLVYSAGFKVINPTKPDHVALLATLPKGRVTPVTFHGNTYFILPDARNNRAFVGGQVEFQRYQMLCIEQKKEAQVSATEASRLDTFNRMNWGAWGGWGALGFYPALH